MKSIFLFIVLVLLNSCTYKSWKNTGIKRKWLDTSSVSATGIMDFDTAKVSKSSDSIIEYILSDHIESPCDSSGKLKPETIQVIKWKVRTELVPAISKIPFEDTLSFTGSNEDRSYTIKLWSNKYGSIEHKITFSGAVIKPPDHKWWECLKRSWWAVLIAFIFGSILNYKVRQHEK